MIFEFIPAMNGCILRVQEDDDDETESYITYQSSDDDEDGSIERFQDFLYQIKNQVLGPNDSRYSKKRIIIKVEPGDKFEPEGE